MHLFILPVWDCTSNFKTEDQTFDQVKQYTNQINRQIKTQWRRANKLISARREIGIYRMSFAFGPSDHFAHLEHAQLAVLINLCWCTSSSQRRKKKSSKKQKKKHLNLNDNRCVKHTATIKRRCVAWLGPIFELFFNVPIEASLPRSHSITSIIDPRCCILITTCLTENLTFQQK